MVVIPIVALAILVIVDIMVLTGSIYLADLKKLKIRWGEITYAFIVKWFLSGAFFNDIYGGNSLAFVGALVILSLACGGVTLSTICAVGGSKKPIDIEWIAQIDRWSTALVYVAAVLFGAVTYNEIIIGKDFPLGLMAMSTLILVGNYRYCGDSMIRTQMNIHYFNLLFEHAPRR